MSSAPKLSPLLEELGVPSFSSLAEPESLSDYELDTSEPEETLRLRTTPDGIPNHHALAEGENAGARADAGVMNSFMSKRETNLKTRSNAETLCPTSPPHHLVWSVWRT